MHGSKKSVRKQTVLLFDATPGRFLGMRSRLTA